MSGTVGFCRELAIDEPLVGTAKLATRFVVLEDPSPWGAKVPRDTELPDHVRAWLARLDAVPATRLLLIRRPGAARVSDRTRKLFVARTSADPAMRRFVELDVELDELPSLDPDALLDRAPATAAIADVWLVCTHGAHDRCCAKWGMGLFETMRMRGDAARVWQSSHLGGHRFAPTMLALPSGLCWGRVEFDDVDEILARAAEGRIGALARLRGRSSLDPIRQAAECLVRLREGIDADAGLRVGDVEAVGQGGHVRLTVGERELEVEVERVLPGFDTPTSCGGAEELRAPLRLRTR